MRELCLLTWVVRADGKFAPVRVRGFSSHRGKKGDVEAIEKVQKWATKLVISLKHFHK